jgi:hypothetical protein
MLTSYALLERGYTPLQVEAHMAHRERQNRMTNAIRLLPAPPPPPVQAAPPPPPPPPKITWKFPLLDFVGVSDNPPKVRVAVIQAIVAADYGIDRAEILSSMRSERFVTPRHVAFYLACKLTRNSLPQIGRAFGDRDHTTVLHAREKIAKMIDASPFLRARVANLEGMCLEVARLEQARFTDAQAQE